MGEPTRPAAGHRRGGARAQQHFFGASHSELWEALAGSPQCATDVTKCRSGNPTVPNGDPAGNYGIDFDGTTPSPHPGITETQAYASFGGDAGLNIQVGRYVRFRGLFGLTIDTPHFITYAASGVDVIDTPGRRYRVEGTQIWSLLLEGSLMF